MIVPSPVRRPPPPAVPRSRARSGPGSRSSAAPGSRRRPRRPAGRRPRSPRARRRAAGPGRSPRRPARRRGAGRPAGRSGTGAISSSPWLDPGREPEQGVVRELGGALPDLRAERVVVEAADRGLEDGDPVARRARRAGDRGRGHDGLADLRAGAGDEDARASGRLAQRGSGHLAAGREEAELRAASADQPAPHAEGRRPGGSPSPSAAAGRSPAGPSAAGSPARRHRSSSRRSQRAIASSASPITSGTICVLRPDRLEALGAQSLAQRGRVGRAGARPARGARPAARARPRPRRRRRGRGGREDERPRGVDRKSISSRGAADVGAVAAERLAERPDDHVDLAGQARRRDRARARRDRCSRWRGPRRPSAGSRGAAPGRPAPAAARGRRPWRRRRR